MANEIRQTKDREEPFFLVYTTWTPGESLLFIFLLSRRPTADPSGSVWESNPQRALFKPATGFEDRTAAASRRIAAVVWLA